MVTTTNEEILKFAEELHKKGKPITTRDVMERFGLSKHAASKRLKYLEERGELVSIRRGKAGAKEYFTKNYLKKQMPLYLIYLKEKYCRNLTIEEIAYEYEESPRNKLFRSKVHKLLKAAGYTTLKPSKKEIEIGQCKAFLNLAIAAFLKFKKNNSPNVKKFFQNSSPLEIQPFDIDRIINKLEKEIEILRNSNSHQGRLEKLKKEYKYYVNMKKEAEYYYKRFKELRPKVEIIKSEIPGFSEDIKFVWPEEASRIIGETNDNGVKPCSFII